MTGGNEGKIVFWNQSLAPTKTIEMTEKVKFSPGLRSIDVGTNTMLVGTRGADVLELNMEGEKTRTIVQGHFMGVTKNAEVWGLAVHPTEQRFASAGADKTVRVFEPARMIAVSEQLTHDPTAVSWSPDGSLIVIGDRNGSCLLLDANDLSVKSTYNGSFAGKKDAWIEDIKFSPDGTMIAYGYHGGLSPLEIVQIGPQ